MSSHDPPRAAGRSAARLPGRAAPVPTRATGGDVAAVHVAAVARREETHAEDPEERRCPPSVHGAHYRTAPSGHAVRTGGRARQATDGSGNCSYAAC